MNKQKISQIIGEKSFWKHAFILAFPIALQNMLTSSFTLVDTLMVGQLGDIALSSVGMAGQWSWLLNMVVFGICSGSAVLVSQYWGIRDKKNIHKILGIAVSIGMVITALFLLAGFLIPEFVLEIFNRTPEVVEAGSSYLRIACFSYPGVVLGTILGAVLRSCEDVKIPVYSAAFTTVANAFLDYSMIFGKFGFPEMGIEGAALATCISAWLGPIIILLISFMKKNILFVPIKTFFSLDRTMLKKFTKTSLPVVCNETLWGLGTVLYNVIFANMGHENFAAVTILKTVENLAYAFFIGLCNACCVMVGTSIGAGKIKRSVTDAKRFGIAIPLAGAITGLVILLLRNPIVGLFNMKGELTVTTFAVAKIILLLYALELPIRNIPYAFIVGIFRSGGDTVSGAKIDMLSLWFIALPLTAILAFVVKAPFAVVFATMYIGEDYLKSFLCIKHFISRKWLKPVTAEGKVGLLKYLEGTGENS